MAAPRNRTEEDCTGIRSSFNQELGEFREHIYPVFAEHGLSFPEALMVYQMNRLNNNVVTLQDILLNHPSFAADDDDDGDLDQAISDG
ncbi:MAG TPA: hypothetical protein PK788_13230 [Gemmatimonadaceae bacterium]|nr:hypothetical protein [Gemmatimonadaceae bacterium]